MHFNDLVDIDNCLKRKLHQINDMVVIDDDEKLNTNRTIVVIDNDNSVLREVVVIEDDNDSRNELKDQE